jgi:hypothetical protein
VITYDMAFCAPYEPRRSPPATAEPTVWPNINMVADLSVLRLQPKDAGLLTSRDRSQAAKHGREGDHGVEMPSRGCRRGVYKGR